MRPRRTETQWKRTFEKYDRSGLTQEQFCEREGLALATFATRRRKLHAAKLAPVPAGFVEVCIPDQAPPAAQDFAGELVVELPYGVILRFRGMRT